MNHRLLARACTFLIVLLIPIIPALGQGSLEDKLAAIEKAVDGKRKELHIPGISLVIVKDDKVLFIKGFGERNIERRLPVTPDTLFAIGSSSKAFTALSVLMSAESGKLNLADNPRFYLPHFALKDAEANSKITIADLLSHRSGLNRTDLAWYTGGLKSDDIVRAAASAAPTARFGEKFQYQNVMYLAAGEIVGRVNRTSWPAFVEKRIFAPLKMGSSNLSITKIAATGNYALGYSYDSETKKHNHLPMRNIDSIAPAGAINSNARDMAQWVRFMLNGGELDGKRLVSERSFAELIKKRITVAGPVGYGLGWFLRDWKGHQIVEHGGNIDGFNAQVALMPDQKLGFALLTNVSASSLGTFTMNTVWEELIGPKDPAPPAVPAGPAVAPDKEAGVYPIPSANASLEVTFQSGKLTFHAPGQPPYPMESVGGRRYKLGSPAPAGFFVTFRQKSGDAAKTEMYLEQPQGNLALTRADSVPFKPSLSVDELMRKAVEALGGEANLRKHHALLLRYRSTYPEQGVSGEGEIRQSAPNKLVESETLIAAGKRIASTREYCDGKDAGLELSFSQPAARTGTTLADSLTAADFYAPLNWKKRFKSVAIVGEGAVAGEGAFIVEKKPEKGSAIKDYYSKSNYLLLKREGPGPIAESFSDYRPVSGVMIPFKRARQSPLTGEGILVITHARFDINSPDHLFAPPTHARSAPMPQQLTSSIHPFDR